MSENHLLPLTDITAGCAPITKEAMSHQMAEHLARALKALSDPARLRIVSLVAAAENKEVCVCDFSEPLRLSQPTVSHHLRVLMDAGFLTRDKRGVWAYYRITPGALDSVSAFFSTV